MSEVEVLLAWRVGSRAGFWELRGGKWMRAQGPGAYLGDIPSLHLSPL